MNAERNGRSPRIHASARCLRRAAAGHGRIRRSACMLPDGYGDSALITGASSGIGHELAIRFAAGDIDLGSSPETNRLHDVATECLADGRPRQKCCPSTSRLLPLRNSSRRLARHPDSHPGEQRGLRRAWPLCGTRSRSPDGSDAGQHDRAGPAQPSVSPPDARARTRTHPERRLDRGLSARAIRQCVLRHQGLRLLLFVRARGGAQNSGVTVTTLCPGSTRNGILHARRDVLRAPAPDDGCRAVAKAGYRGLMRGRRVVIPGASNRITSLLESGAHSTRHGSPSHRFTSPASSSAISLRCRASGMRRRAASSGGAMKPVGSTFRYPLPPRA